MSSSVHVDTVKGPSNLS